ncbi:hypothetical protein CYMTET_37649 [Cymbomonas tetramitiformis]|uniref:Uncharacterized protein n=1 Tax=Cymbomonas tetramitiformis TaxID=36881 RepID=A0AAE0CEU5_9CHLO|nr:hypothetical protein CYMTET_37649 [Cymbomonas tetramitiformis]
MDPPTKAPNPGVGSKNAFHTIPDAVLPYLSPKDTARIASNRASYAHYVEHIYTGFVLKDVAAALKKLDGTVDKLAHFAKVCHMAQSVHRVLSWNRVASEGCVMLTQGSSGLLDQRVSEFLHEHFFGYVGDVDNDQLQCAEFRNSGQPNSAGRLRAALLALKANHPLRESSPLKRFIDNLLWVTVDDTRDRFYLTETWFQKNMHAEVHGIRRLSAFYPSSEEYMAIIREISKEDPLFGRLYCNNELSCEGVLTNVYQAQEWCDVCDELRLMFSSHYLEPEQHGDEFVVFEFEACRHPRVTRGGESRQEILEKYLLHVNYVLDHVFRSQANPNDVPDWAQLFWRCLSYKEGTVFIEEQPALLCARYCYSRLESPVFDLKPPDAVKEDRAVYHALRQMLRIARCGGFASAFLQQVTVEFRDIFEASVTALEARARYRIVETVK